jgi:hypothetical protein
LLLFCLLSLEAAYPLPPRGVGFLQQHFFTSLAARRERLLARFVLLAASARIQKSCTPVFVYTTGLGASKKVKNAANKTR